MLHREGFGEPCGSNNDCQLRYFISPHNRQTMNKTILVMAAALLAVSSCKKKSDTSPGGSGSTPQTFADYFPGLGTMKAGSDAVYVTGQGKPGTISHSGLSFTIWPSDGKKNTITSATTSGWSYSITITDAATGNVADGSLGRYQYLNGRPYYMLFLFSNSLISEAQFVDSL
jgi:hypothetical protein